MTNYPGYRLVLSILFTSEQDLEKAIFIFGAWCSTQNGPNKKYGFIRKDKVRGELFLSSPSPLHTHPKTTHFRDSLIRQLGGRVVITSTNCNLLKSKKPAN